MITAERIEVAIEVIMMLKRKAESEVSRSYRLGDDPTLAFWQADVERHNKNLEELNRWLKYPEQR